MPDRIALGDSVASRYLELVADGVIVSDPAQKQLVERLDRLNASIKDIRLASKSSSLGWLFAKKTAAKGRVRGLYIHGSVGRGKTMLMDFFFRACPAVRKRRVHFHDFMAEVHDRIGAQRECFKAGQTKEVDPIAPVARDLAEEARVLCFDEFSVTDIADAMILSRLFTVLFKKGVVLVATSNVMPDDLYRDGLNRSLFTPFIDLLADYVDVHDLDAERDYRLGRLSQTPLYISPLGTSARESMDAIWHKVTGGLGGKHTQLTVKGRQVDVPMSAMDVARFSFADLCEKPLGARDYLMIARHYHTIMIDDVPVLGRENRNEAKRFINLVDTLYDNHNKLVISAAAEPTALYQANSGTEAFEFDRTASRLIEMRSDDWANSEKAGRKVAS